MQNIGTFYILNWAAWAPGLDTNEKWRLWANCLQAISGDDKIQTTLIPAGIKRRCSEVTRMALHVSTLAAQGQNIEYGVFGAQHGELQRCVDLFDFICNQESLSPMAFAQSVHNTASGLFSIIHKKTHSMNAIAAGEQTFNMSLIDALVWMKLNPGSKVLVTVYDDYFPEAYTHLDIGVNCRYALSFVISYTKPENGDCSAISCELDHVEQNQKETIEEELPQALNFLAWYLSNTIQPWVQLNNHQTFICKKI